jgi:hypothetical protein
MKDQPLLVLQSQSARQAVQLQASHLLTSSAVENL